MYDLNVVAFTGRLGRDPEMRYVPSGDAVTNFPIAVQTGQESVMWLDISVWGKAAEACNEYLAKGRRVAVNGKLVQDTWETEDGQKRSKYKVTAFSVTFLGGKSREDTGESFSDSGPAAVRPDGGPEPSSDIADEFPL